MSRIALIVAVAIVTMMSCRPQEIVEEPFEPTASHEDYRSGLAELEIDDTAIGSAWITAAERALGEPFSVSVPFTEIARFEPTRPDAVGFRFAALRGQRVQITLEIENGDGGRMFADLFRVGDDENEPYPQVAAYSEELNRLEFEPRRDAEYILRLQPELLRGGNYTVTVRTTPSLSFPVEGHGTDDIWSVFGDPRDGGARLHEGVDVFAPRGTPVLAVAPGVVRGVGFRNRGGQVVSIIDEQRGLVYYYAHLDQQLTAIGVRVEPGDVIGTVGNTGNAITTPPHLHFGIYERRWNAIDPWNFLYTYNSEPIQPGGDQSVVGSPARVVVEGITLDDGRGDVLVERDETVVIEGIRAGSYRVHVPRLARSGYVPLGAIAEISG